MAELKHNKKALESQKIIYKSLRRLLLVKPLSEITITDIKDECNISRTTFYRNFNNVVDVLEVMLDYFYSRYLDDRIGNENQLLFFFTYWKKHRDLIHIIANQNPSILKTIMKRYSTQEKNNDYFLEIKYAVFTSIICRWSENPEETPEELEKMTKEYLSKRGTDILLK